MAQAPSTFIPLRESPEASDAYDGKRVEFYNRKWAKDDDLYRHFNRQVEENVRMLSGQQYSIYHPVLGVWIDPTDFMTDEERRWRQRPVFNRILPWYILTHARMTENQPIITFVPGPDRIDAELAEVMDIAQKSLWREVGMVDQLDRVAGWMIVGGRAHTLSRIDTNKGPMKEWRGLADVPVVDAYGEAIPGPDGQPQVAADQEDVPFDRDGNPLAQMTPDGIRHTGQPHAEPEGVLKVDVLSPLQVRGSWGPSPWHEKRIHQIMQYLTTEEVYDLTGKEIAPDTRGGSNEIGELERVLFGTGFYGAADSKLTPNLSSAASTEGYVQVLSTWEAPCSYGGLEETDESPGGRVTVVTKKECLIDAVRPAKFPYTSPLRTYEFIRIPGRMGSTPQEVLNPVQRQYNEGYARISEHVNLLSNPKTIIDSQTKINAKQWTNEPGQAVKVVRRPNVPAVEYLKAPPLGEDVYKLQEMLLRELTDLGNLQGTQGEVPSKDASGELVKELRFNSDRFLGPTMRRMVEELGRKIEDWQQLIPLMWDTEKLLSYSGEDNVARTIVVMPYMFQKGKINVVPDVESMLPEGRGERQTKVYRMYMDGLLGEPGTPPALKRFYELAHFPHLSRIAKPGGIDRITADQENGQLVQGEDPRKIPVYEWYDHDVHLMVLEDFMKSPEFKKQNPQIQEGFVFHRQAHKMAAQIALQKQVMEQARMQVQAQGAAALGAAQGGGGGGAPGGGGPPAPSNNVRPQPPKPPRGAVPGGRMPTAPLGA